jgi:hypothetical protein
LIRQHTYARTHVAVVALAVVALAVVALAVVALAVVALAVVGECKTTAETVANM